MASNDPASPAAFKPRLLYVVSEDWYFLSHRLPMARAARAAGFDVHVATRVVDGGGAIAREGFVLHPIPFARGRLALWANLRTIGVLRRIHRRIRPALVHRVALQPVLLDGLAAIGLSTPAVNAITGLGYAFASASIRARLLRAVIGRLLRWLAGRKSVLLVQNPDDACVLTDLGIDRESIILVPGSGVDVETLQPQPEPQGPVTIAFAARLIESKGIRVLVEAHRLLRDRGVDVDLLIAGARDEANPASVTNADIAAWSHQRGLSLLGHVQDIAGLWARAHMAILPSMGGEGVPKSLLEAAACGRALIAADVPGCREIAINGRTGLLVPPGDADALADAIERLSTTPELRRRFALEARRVAAEQFSEAVVSRNIAVLYSTLLDRHPQPGRDCHVARSLSSSAANRPSGADPRRSAPE